MGMRGEADLLASELIGPTALTLASSHRGGMNGSLAAQK